MARLFFSEDMISSVIQQQEPLYKECIGILQSSPSNIPQEIALSNWAPKTDGGIWGVRLEIKHPLSPTHSGWLYWRLTESLPKDGQTGVGYAVQGAFKRLGQFTLALEDASEIYIVAIGPKAKSAVEEIISAEATFRPENFDEDGYPKSRIDKSGQPVHSGLVT